VDRCVPSKALLADAAPTRSDRVYSVSGNVRPARREQEQSGGAQQKVAVTDVRGCGHAIYSLS